MLESPAAVTTTDDDDEEDGDKDAGGNAETFVSAEAVASEVFVPVPFVVVVVVVVVVFYCCCDACCDDVSGDASPGRAPTLRCRWVVACGTGVGRTHSMRRRWLHCVKPR